jgi:hypothetical protein
MMVKYKCSQRMVGWFFTKDGPPSKNLKFSQASGVHVLLTANDEGIVHDVSEDYHGDPSGLS